MQKWGRIKIVRALEAHGVSSRCIQRGLNEIEGPAYTRALKALLSKKLTGTKEENLFSKRQKAANFAIGKGYEPELVWEMLRDLTQE